MRDKSETKKQFECICSTVTSKAGEAIYYNSEILQFFTIFFSYQIQVDVWQGAIEMGKTGPAENVQLNRNLIIGCTTSWSYTWCAVRWRISPRIRIDSQRDESYIQRDAAFGLHSICERILTPQQLSTWLIIFFVFACQ